jgi:hypothetical protein
LKEMVGLRVTGSIDSIDRNLHVSILTLWAHILPSC